MRIPNKLEFTLGLLLFAAPAFAADLAILRNGFSVRHERREHLGKVTRLYLAAGNSSYVDIANDQIERFEKDQSPAIIAPSIIAPPTTAVIPPPPAKAENITKTQN